jgi:pre-mRNA-processing factor 39
MKAKVADDGKASTTDRRLLMENGHPGVEVDEAAIRRGENPYTKYYQQQGEHPLPGAGQVSESDSPSLPQSAKLSM